MLTSVVSRVRFVLFDLKGIVLLPDVLAIRFGSIEEQKKRGKTD
jgi:hypothetical protein